MTEELVRQKCFFILLKRFSVLQQVQQVTPRKYSRLYFGPLMKPMYNGAANIEVSAGVAPCNMVDFGIFLNFCCETSFRKSRTAFYFCNGRNDRSDDKSKFHCATPVRETTGFTRFCHALCMSQSETRTIAFRDQFQPFMLHRSRLLKLVSQRRCTSVSDKRFNV